MAVKRPKIKSAGAAQSPLLGSVMFAPAVVYILLLIGLPFVMAIYYAFSDIRIGSVGWPHFIGLENFRSILQSPSFQKAWRNSIIFTIGAQIIVIICANILSIALEKPFRGRGFVRFLILLPWVAPVSLGTIGWKWILDSIYSVITWVLVWLGFAQPYTIFWLGQEKLAMLSVILVHCWRLIPFSTVILLAGRTAIPREIPEAAAIDGAGFWRTLFQINLPMMTPILSVVVLFGIIFTFTDMAVVYILTNGGPYDATQTLPMLAYTQGIQASDLAAGAAISVFLVPVLVLIAYFMLRIARRAEVV